MHLDYTDYSPYSCSFSLAQGLFLACVALRRLALSVRTCTSTYTFTFCWLTCVLGLICCIIPIHTILLYSCTDCVQDVYILDLLCRNLLLVFYFYIYVRIALRFPFPPLRSDSSVPPTVFLQPCWQYTYTPHVLVYLVYVRTALHFPRPTLRSYAPCDLWKYSADLVGLFCRY